MIFLLIIFTIIALSVLIQTITFLAIHINSKNALVNFIATTLCITSIIYLVYFIVKVASFLISNLITL
jgi:hypothetical protein